MGWHILVAANLAALLGVSACWEIAICLALMVLLKRGPLRSLWINRDKKASVKLHFNV